MCIYILQGDKDRVNEIFDTQQIPKRVCADDVSDEVQNETQISEAVLQTLDTWSDEEEEDDDVR